MFQIERLDPLEVTCLAQRDPHTPRERVDLAQHGNLQAAAHEEMLSIDDAVVAPEVAAFCAMHLRYLVEAQRSVCAKARDTLVELPAAVALKSEGHGVLLSVDRLRP